MSVLTEAMLRARLKGENLEELREYRVDDDVIVTPAAKGWLIDNKIDLLVGDKWVVRNPASPKPQDPPGQSRPADLNEKVVPAQPQSAQSGNGVLPAFEKPDRYESIYGGTFAEKPEHMTALRGNLLVNKDHKRIQLRGKLDSLEAGIMEAQLAFRRLGMETGVSDLGEVLSYTKQILRSEVLEVPIEPMVLFGMDETELRERSHKPNQFYGLPHFAPSIDDGEAVVVLNRLRTETRELEITAYEAFKTETGIPERGDIMQALNRLSSVFYVMMFRVKAKEYEA